MSSFISKTLGRMLLPNLETDLAKAVNQGIQSSAKMTDCFLAPSVYGFEMQQSTATTITHRGLGHATSALETRSMVKVHYPIPAKGLFR